MKHTILGMAITAFGLAGCGGGSGGDDAAANSGTTTTTDTSNANTSTGSVSADFAKSAAPAPSAVVGIGSQSLVKSSQVVQTNGAITTLGNYVITGTNIVTKDIAGDTTFAMGRWVQGTITRAGASFRTLDGTSANDFFHYLVFNALPAIPTSGTKICNAGTFTTPSRINGTAGAVLETMGASSAQLNFVSSGVAVTLTLNVAGTGNTYQDFIAIPSVTTVVGAIGGVQSGASLTLGDGGNGAIRLGGSFQTLLQNGSTYQGVYTFLCT